jgi:hypothetical protein
MPDFLDRLIARSSHPDGGGSGSGAAAAGPERLAGMAVARPQVPGLFERRAPPVPEDDLEAAAAAQPAPLGSTDLPRATAPAVAHLSRTHARLVQAPAAYLGMERDREPHQSLPTAVAALLPAAPQLGPAPAAAPAAQPLGRGGIPAVRMHPGKDPGGVAGEPVAPRLAARPAPQARPRIASAALAPPRVPVTAQPGGAAASRSSQVPPPPAGPIVRISIGRIEVRPAGPAGSHGPARPAAARPAPALTLDRFLAGEAGER